jgi:hypothetical protein
MPVKKQKKIKLRAVRGARSSKPPTKKPSVKQTVNVYTTSTQPYRTDFRDQFRYGLGYVDPIREQTPFQPVFNYIQPPVQAPVPAVMSGEGRSTLMQMEPQKKEEAKPKRKYTKKEKIVAIAELFNEPSSRKSTGGYESEFMPSEQELERAVIAKQKRAEEEFSQAMKSFATRGSSEGDIMPVTKRRGRPAGSKSKPKESPFDQPPPAGQQSIAQFFGKIGGGGGGGSTPVFIEDE